MVVSIIGSYTIRPSKPTWEGVLPLSEFDQIGIMSHVPTIYFYKPSKEWLKSSNNSFMDALKESLSQALVHFYPVAGRVRRIGRGRLELLCNNMGVELIEAKSSNQLSDYGDFASNTHQFKNLIPLVDYNKPIKELPLMLGQLTLFQCGGISLGVTMCHAVVDGQSALHFMTEWARLARGEPLEAAPYIDHHSFLKGPKPNEVQVTPFNNTDLTSPPLLIGQENNLEERRKVTTVLILPLGKNQVETLKKEANKSLDDKNGRPYTRYEVVTAHIWRSACKARGLQNEQSTGLGFSVDIRSRLHPPLPPKYFGNAIIDVVASSTAREVTTSPLGYTCGKIRDAMMKVNDEFVWSNIEFLRSQPDLSVLQDPQAGTTMEGPFYGNPNLGVISWLTLPIYGLDFGWGKEIYMGPGTHDSDGDCLMLPGPENDGSVNIALCFQVAHVEDFKKHFYEDISC